jgi:hypothetical protein
MARLEGNEPQSGELVNPGITTTDFVFVGSGRYAVLLLQKSESRK